MRLLRKSVLVLGAGFALGACKRTAHEAPVAEATLASAAAPGPGVIPPAAVQPDLGRSTGWSDTADIKLEVNERTYLFPKRCDGTKDQGGLASGGVALKTPLLRKLISDRLNAPARISSTDEDSLLGLLILAIKFTGRTRSVVEAIDKLRLEAGI